MSFSINKNVSADFNAACEYIERLVSRGLVTKNEVSVVRHVFTSSSEKVYYLQIEDLQVWRLNPNGNSKQRSQLLKKWVRSIQIELDNILMKHLVGAL